MDLTKIKKKTDETGKTEFVTATLSKTYQSGGQLYGPDSKSVPRGVAIKDAYLRERQKAIDGGMNPAEVPSLADVLRADKEERAEKASETAQDAAEASEAGSGTAAGSRAATGHGEPDDDDDDPDADDEGDDDDDDDGEQEEDDDDDGEPDAADALPDDFPHVEKLRAQGIETFAALDGTDAEALEGVGPKRWAEIEAAVAARA